MFRRFFVAAFHVKKREIRMDELFFRTELLGLVTLGNGRSVVSFSIIGHSQRELCVEVIWIHGKNRFQLCDGFIVLAFAEGVHRFVVLVLQALHRFFLTIKDMAPV